MKTFLMIVLILMAPCFAHAGETRSSRVEILPLDEAVKDPDLFIFRRDLIHALIRKDKAYIESIVDPEIKYSFGNEGGLTEFYKSWRINEADTKFYQTLIGVLLNGGEFMGEQFCAPYTFTTNKIEDAFQELIVISKDAPVHSKAEVSGEVIYHASYERLKAHYDNPVKAWAGVYTPSGAKGYLEWKYAVSPVDYRACFSKKDGQYKMNIFIAGD